jgi:hypothetical protein
MKGLSAQPAQGGQQARQTLQQYCLEHGLLLPPEDCGGGGNCFYNCCAAAWDQDEWYAGDEDTKALLQSGVSLMLSSVAVVDRHMSTGKLALMLSM